MTCFQVLDEFYANLHSVGISAATGAGIDELFERIGVAAGEYEEHYLPALKERIAAKKQREQDASMARLKRDLKEADKVGMDGGRVMRAQTPAGGGESNTTEDSKVEQ